VPEGPAGVVRCGRELSAILLRRGSSGVVFFDRKPHLADPFPFTPYAREGPNASLPATGRKMFTICIIKANG